MPVPNSACSRTSTGGTTGVKPFSSSSVQHPLDERELEPHERPLQVDEARAGHPGARLEVTRCSPSSSTWLAARRPASPSSRSTSSSTAARRVGQVGQRGEHRRAPLLHLAQLLLELLLALRDALHLRDRLRRVRAGALQLADPLRGLVLPPPQLLQPRQQRPPALVELERLVEQRHVEPAPAQAPRARPPGPRGSP